ncbi:MAG: DUF523 domain-containing protein [Myxococcales bacterium]|nr:DUF523 domain-containing protein [Myxococcales bacterium]
MVKPPYEPSPPPDVEPEADALPEGLLPGEGRPRLGVSACLLGHVVRHDAAPVRGQLVTDALSPFVEFVPVCPEVESGMSVPREAMRLVSSADGHRLLGIHSKHDYTAQVEDFTAKKIEVLSAARLDGFLLKSGSPSCGLVSARIYAEAAKSVPEKVGSGLFAARLCEQMPDLVVAEEDALTDESERRRFLVRLFLAYRARTSLTAESTPALELLRTALGEPDSAAR